MFAFVSNEYQGVVYSKQHLKVLKDLYSYPIAQFCKTEEEARQFIEKHPRKFYSGDAYKKAGWTKKTGYIRIEYYIDNNNIYANMYTDHFGFVKLNLEFNPNVIQDAQYDRIKVKIKNVRLNNDSITSHCSAVSYLCNLLNPAINVQIIVPDISIYLALTEYKGNNAVINRITNELSSRIGKVAFVLK